MIEMWRNDDGQDIAEYALMLAILLLIVVAVIQAIGGGANHVFSSIASKMASVI